MSNKVRLILISFFLLLSFCIIPSLTSVSAQCVITNVGAPKLSPKPPPECGTAVDGGPIVEWAQKIADKLEKGANGYLSKMVAEICNGKICAHKKIGLNNVPDKYWCTWIVIDAYTLAGIKVPQNLVAVGLYKEMKGLPNFQGAGASGVENLRKVKPGYAIAFGQHENDGPGGHIGLVKSITIDAKGNGKIITLESNSSAKSHIWPIAKGVIKKGVGKPILGFAGQK